MATQETALPTVAAPELSNPGSTCSKINLHAHGISC